MNPPTCRLCHTAHWPSTPHVWKKGQDDVRGLEEWAKPGQALPTEGALPTSVTNKPQSVTNKGGDGGWPHRSNVARKEAEALKNERLRAAVDAMPVAKPYKKPSPKTEAATRESEAAAKKRAATKARQKKWRDANAEKKRKLERERLQSKRAKKP